MEASSYPQYSPVRVWGARGQQGWRELEVPKRFTEVAEIPPDGQAFQVAQLMRRFIRAINQREEFHPNFGEATQLHKILEAVKRSSASGGWETVS